MIRSAILLAGAALLAPDGPLGRIPGARQDAPVIRVTDAGQGEKREIRFKPVVGQKRTETLYLNHELQLTLDGKTEPPEKIPGLILQVNVTVAGVNAAGDARYDVVFLKVEGDEIAPEFKVLEGASGKIVTSSQGVIKEQDFKPPAKSSARVARIVQSLNESMLAESPAFPKEAVGLGATWEVRQAASFGGLAVEQTATFKVTRLDEEAVGLRIDAKQTVGPFEGHIPGTPEGSKFYLDSLVTRGSGDVTWELGWGDFPSKSSIDLRGILKGRTEAGGVTHRATVVSDLRLSLSTINKNPTVIHGAQDSVKPADSSKVIDPWANQEPGAWYRFRIRTGAEEVYSDIGLKARGGKKNILVTQKFDKAGAGPEEELPTELRPIPILGESTLQIQGRDTLCQVLESQAGEKKWILWGGRHHGAVLRIAGPQGRLEPTQLWENTIKVKGHEFDCVVVEAEWKTGEKVERIKTWYSGAFPLGPIREERPGVSRILVDFGPRWAERPAPKK